jgi:hypothetical protein
VRLTYCRNLQNPYRGQVFVLKKHIVSGKKLVEYTYQKLSFYDKNLLLLLAITKGLAIVVIWKYGSPEKSVGLKWGT